MVEINSGFPIRFDDNGDGSADRHGFIGYWGIWTEGDRTLPNGSTVIRDTNGQQVEYTVVAAPGRLIRHSVESLPLTNLDGISFHYMDGVVLQDDSFDRWVVNYLEDTVEGISQDGFYKVSKLKWRPDAPPQFDDLDSPELISLSPNENLHFFSDQLGGEVRFLYGETSITYYVETFIDGSQTGAGELLNGGSISLKCWDNCPIGTVDASDISSYSGPFIPFDPNNPTTSHAYTFSVSGGNALTLVRGANSEPVMFNTAITPQELQSSAHNWGMRSGPMVLSSQSVTNPWDVYDPTIVSEYYVWETGPHNWNRMTTVRDSDSNIVSFQRPIQFTYVHSDANDRSGNAGDYDGQATMLNYGGDGDLWGIPHESHLSEDIENEDSEHHYRPAFSIRDGVLMGDSDQYVIKAREVEELMVELPRSQCANMLLSDPAVDVPASAAGSADIGEMPTVTGEPSVVAGVNQ